MNNHEEEFHERVAADLDRFADLSTSRLHDAVSRQGLCQWLYTSGEVPAWSGDDRADRVTAARICAECPVAGECLEWELRTAGYATDGVWGLLAADDRRRVFLSWVQRRDGGERP
ncbi:MAG TPA: WhiB family transcriptional regulator [Actinophytocola sp.]|uniref:WhiB family transcriptional regulator n=1 Tax=Actinophytocola sp. TaxID=1872138 RepID=UPI002DDD9E14|nr:WhiB family transcriptional regulator [Actinophytocola sp.]HEV2780208.1 WhiB family transcriptional regulator [Actinophytocola sp.]